MQLFISWIDFESFAAKYQDSTKILISSLLYANRFALRLTAFGSKFVCLWSDVQYIALIDSIRKCWLKQKWNSNLLNRLSEVLCTQNTQLIQITVGLKEDSFLPLFLPIISSDLSYSYDEIKKMLLCKNRTLKTVPGFEHTSPSKPNGSDHKTTKAGS